MNSSERKIHVFGIGGMGCTTLKHFHRQNVDAKFTCITYRDQHSFAPDIAYFEFTPPGTTFSNIKGVKTERANWDQQAMLTDEIKVLFQDDCHYVLLSGLGDPTGAYLTLELTHWLTEEGKKFDAICSLPFTFESPGRTHAEQTLPKLQVFSNVRSLDVSGIQKQFPNLMLDKALKMVEDRLFEMFLEIISSKTNR
jgi:cell division GTPase FtsZ